jgi:hypothetical protein
LKIRTEFVTNSSSTSFGASFADAIAGVLLGLAALGCDCSNVDDKDEDDDELGGSDGGGSGEDAALQGAMAAAEQAAQQAADQLAADAAAKDALIGNILDAEGDKLDAAGSKIDQEIDTYTKQWTDAQATADKNDPNYENMNKQYQDYIEYLKNQKAQIEAQKYQMAVTKAEEEAAKTAQNDWIRQQQEDFIQVKEQKAYLEAVANGYGQHKSYDISAVQSQIDALKQREAELQGTLKANNAEINYAPKERMPIGPDPEIIRIQQEHKQKMDELQNEINAAKEARNNARRDELIREQQWQQKVAENEMAKASFWNVLTKAGEITQTVADTGVDILSNLTGPAGKTIKTVYTGLKGVAGGLGEGLANGNMAAELGKGALGGLSDIAKDKLGGFVGDRWGEASGKAAQNIYNIGAEAGKEMYGTFVDGPELGKEGEFLKTIVSSGFKGALKGTLDSSLNMIGDGILPEGGKIPEGLDWSDINAGTFINSIRNSNPLTQSFGKTAIKSSLQGLATDQGKNFIKGDGVIFDNWNQDFTGKVIDTAGDVAGEYYTPGVTDGLTNIYKTGKAIQNTADNMRNFANQYTNPFPYVY